MLLTRGWGHGPESEEVWSQFRAEVAGFITVTDRPIAEMARELESGVVTLRNSVNEWNKRNPEPDKSLTPVERACLAEIEDEIHRLRMENEFHRKGTAFFAKT